MAVDYDAPKDVEAQAALAEQELAELRAAAGGTAAGLEDEESLDGGLEPPGADLSAESLVVAVVPVRADEFTCARCFLVVHRSRRAGGSDLAPECTDCW